MAVYELKREIREGTPKGGASVGFGTEVLLSNAKWFTLLRWLVAIVLAACGIAGRYFPSLSFFDVDRDILSWPLILAIVLSAANVFFSRRVSELGAASDSEAVYSNLWLQIILDLTVLTVVVHYVGSIETYIAFAYLFHIVLACIFFPRRDSLIVTLLSAGFYAICVMLETGGVIMIRSLIENSFVQRPADNAVITVYVCSAVFTWIVVWYLVSTLSATVSARNTQIREANEKLEKASSEKNQQMLKTTHDLKAPFSGMETNIQILRMRYWDELSDDVRDIVGRIELKSQILQERIKAILHFGELRSVPEQGNGLKLEKVDLAEILRDAGSDIAAKAEDREISIDLDVPGITVKSDARQLTALFKNLISNAVFYSADGKKVRAEGARKGDMVEVSVIDEGIGISEEALPHIFEEFYSSTEGAQFNRMSTGLGLAIVREIVELLDLKILVESQLGKGSTFKVLIPIDPS